MLKIRNMTKSFSSHKVLENINLEIEQGKLTSLLGENGSGKSTLLNIIAGIELADVGGEVTYKERRLDEVNFPYTHDVFIAHEKINYILPITISEYINLLKRGIPKWNNNLFDQMVKDRKINLNENFLNFSRGQKMQVALMIGLASNASILLLDEITSVIDVYGRKYFLDLIGQHVKMGNTVVITTNIINELEYYTDNLIVLKNKKIVLNKSVSDIPLQFLKIRKKDNNTNHPIFSHKDCVWSGVNSDKSTSYIIPIDLCKEQEIPEEIKDRRKPSLEDIFIYFFNKNENKYEDIA